jgi:Zn-dependent protease
MPLLLFVGTGGQFLFAYAKPVPYNPYNLKNQRWGPVVVALAGPAVNFLLALAFGLAIRLLSAGSPISAFLAIIVYANILLGVFNLVPIPPLDGSKVLYAVMPASWYGLQQTLERYGFMILLVFIFFFFPLLSPIIQLLFALFTGFPWLL